MSAQQQDRWFAIIAILVTAALALSAVVSENFVLGGLSILSIAAAAMTLTRRSK